MVSGAYPKKRKNTMATSKQAMEIPQPMYEMNFNATNSVVVFSFCIRGGRTRSKGRLLIQNSGATIGFCEGFQQV
jgi:hypothetical protein